MAIYNGIILDLNFPSVVYKKLLGFKANFEDLCIGFPSFGDGLKQLLEYDGDVENDLGLTFQVGVLCILLWLFCFSCFVFSKNLC